MRMAMELRALFLLPLCFPALQGQPLEAQRRREGDTLYIQCPYQAWTTDKQTKYWGFRKDGVWQNIVHTYYESSKRSQDGRTEIKDNSTSKTVSITMTNLKTQDSGTYWCATQHSGHPLLKTISLNVFKELLRWELDTLSVQCPRSSVVWCRRAQTDCKVLAEASFRQNKMKPPQDKASIKYVEGIPTVTMRQLQSRDSGVYWCALGSEREMEVVLSVFKRTQQHRAEESGNVTVQCHYRIADYRDVSKAWCKKGEGETCTVLVSTSPEPPAGHSPAREGVRIQDDSQQGVVTVTMEQLQLQDSGVYWCALQQRSGLARMEEITLSVSKAVPPGAFPEGKNQENFLGDSPEPSGNTFIILTVVLLILLLLALVASVVLGVRHYKLLGRAGNREAEDSSDRSKGTAQPGSTGRRESSQDDSKGPAYINLEMQPHPNPEDPLYCNVEPGQAPRNPQHVDYAIIAFNQAPRSGRE